MNRAVTGKLLLSSLSVYKNVLNHSLPKAFYKLLCLRDSRPDEFLKAYGQLYYTLCRKGCSTNLAFGLTQTMLFEDNPFSRMCLNNSIEEIPDSVKQAVLHDGAAVAFCGQIKAQDIIREYKYYDEIKDIAKTLPQWETGEPVQQLQRPETCLEELYRFYKTRGCGVFAQYQAFIWRGGKINPVEYPDPVQISDLTGYEYERNKVYNNTKAFIENRSCNNCLLYGDKGTGKSTTVKAVFNQLKDRGLRIIEMPKESLMDFPLLVDSIAGIPMKFIVFVDDLSFQRQDESYASLKAVLEGSLTARPENVLIYATSNRRHLVKETFEDNANYSDIHPNDSKEETLSLYDRFGLCVWFSAPGKQDYLDIVQALAEKYGVTLDRETLLKNAEIFALAKGGRSPRCAIQYIKSLFN